MKEQSVRHSPGGFALQMAILLFIVLTPLPAGASSGVGPRAWQSSPTPPVEYTLRLPLLVDSNDGRLYATVLANGQEQHIGVFSARDGRTVTTFPHSEQFGLDAMGNRLFVMSGQDRVTVLDARTGKRLRTIQVNGARSAFQSSASPQYDAATGQLLVFSGHVMTVLDPNTGKKLRSVPFDVPAQDRCRMASTEPLPIDRAHFDPERRLVYLDFATYVCTPWVGYTILVYDLARQAEIGRLGTETISALAVGGGLYVESWHRFGIGTIWTAKDGQPDRRSTGWSRGSQFQLDSRRGRLYQSGDGSVRIFDPTDMSLTAVVPQPVKGELAAYDPVSDQLYFVDAATVRSWPAGKLISSPATMTQMKNLPSEPVRFIVTSPAWRQDKTLFAVSSSEWTDNTCYVFNQTNNSGPLLMSRDAGKQWLQGHSGLPAGCGLVSALAISPAYHKDQTILTGIRGNGIFKSTDGGTVWRPAGKGLPHMAVSEIALSPGFATDRMAFASVYENGLQRSRDGGESWEPLQTSTHPRIALSPEFDRDGTVAVYGMKASGTVVQLSEDRGDHWRDLTSPSNALPTLLSLAPNFGRWRVMFAGDGNGDLFRSADGGQSWQPVLHAGTEASASGIEQMQMVYGPNEERREVFLVVSGTRYDGEKRIVWGRLYRSADGGQTWARMDAGKGSAPTALAISPQYGHDRSLLVGTADGRVIIVTP